MKHRSAQTGFSTYLVVTAVGLLVLVIIAVSYFLFLSRFVPTPEWTKTTLSTQTSQPKVGREELIAIILETSAGCCHSARLEIRPDGRVFYFAKTTDDKEIQDHANFTENQVDSLVKLIGENFLELKDRLPMPDDPLDGAIYTLSVNFLPQGPHPELRDSIVHSVRCYETRCEERFLKLKNKIIEFWGKDF